MLYNFKHVREKAQREQMEKMEADGVCLFCREHIETYHREPIEEEGDFWLLTKNDFPYEGTEIHYLIVYKPHIQHLAEVEPAAWNEFGELIRTLHKRLPLPGGALFMRFGDTDYNGSSISHLHAHIMVGAPHTEEAEAIRVKLGYKKI